MSRMLHLKVQSNSFTFKFFLKLACFAVEREILGTASQYMTKNLHIFSYKRKPFFKEKFQINTLLTS
jgi:hypothetical protein